MSSQFKVHFTRYDSKRVEMRLSGPTWLHADDFAGANRIAEAILSGLKGSDPARDYAIASISNHGFHAEECGGGYMFETKDEFSARVNAKLAAEGDAK